MDVLHLIALVHQIDGAQEYLMKLAEKYGEITLTIKNEKPVVTVFLGSGPTAPIGFGSSIAGALLDSLDSQKKHVI